LPTHRKHIKTSTGNKGRLELAAARANIINSYERERERESQWASNIWNRSQQKNTHYKRNDMTLRVVHGQRQSPIADSYTNHGLSRRPTDTATCDKILSAPRLKLTT